MQPSTAPPLPNPNQCKCQNQIRTTINEARRQKTQTSVYQPGQLRDRVLGDDPHCDGDGSDGGGGAKSRVRVQISDGVGDFEVRRSRFPRLLPRFLSNFGSVFIMENKKESKNFNLGKYFIYLLFHNKLYKYIIKISYQPLTRQSLIVVNFQEKRSALTSVI